MRQRMVYLQFDFSWMTAKSFFLLLVGQKVGLFSCPITGARLQHFLSDTVR